MDLVAVGSARDGALLPLPDAPLARERGLVTAWMSLTGDLEVDPACDPIGAEVAGVAAEARAATARTAHAEARLAAGYIWGAAEYAFRSGARTDVARREWGARAMLAELAAALRLPEGTLARKLTRLTTLEAFPRLRDAHEAGSASAWHVDVVLDVFRGVTDRDVLARADVFVAERAVRMTAPELRASARGWRSRHIPRTEEQRRANLADRRVEIAPADEDMVWLTALVPAAAGIAIDERLSRLATAAGGSDGERTVGQRRADAFVDLLLDPAASWAGPTANGHPTGTDDEDSGRDESTGAVVDRAGDSDTGGDRGAVACRDRDAGDDRCGAPAPVPGWVRGVKAEVVLTVPVLSLLGRSQEPAELEGFGPIDLDTARMLCASAPSFIRVLTHPETGAVLSVGRERYRVPADLKRAVQLRDVTCRFPGCRRRARRCDVDHSTAWQHGGETRVCNLACLCRRHHRLKHELGWQVDQRPGGILDWTSPTGLRHSTEPATRWPRPPRPPRPSRAPTRCDDDEGSPHHDLPGGDPPDATPCGGVDPPRAPGYPDEPPF